MQPKIGGAIVHSTEGSSIINKAPFWRTMLKPLSNGVKFQGEVKDWGGSREPAFASVAILGERRIIPPHGTEKAR